MKQNHRGVYPPDWKPIRDAVRAEAGHVCIRCGSSHRPKEGYALTVHHLDCDKSNVRWFNLVALCQRCHLKIQGRVVLARPWVWEHSPWFRPYVGDGAARRTARAGADLRNRHPGGVVVKWNGERDISDSILAVPRRRWAPEKRGRLGVAVLLLAIAVAVLVPGDARADLDQHGRHEATFRQDRKVEFATVEDVIRYHATSRGVRPEPIIALAQCESSMNPEAIGDHGTSHGLFQLSELPTGLLRHFYLVGFSSPYDTEQVAAYVSMVAAGAFLPGRPDEPPLHPYGRIDLSRWSCWRIVNGR